MLRSAVSAALLALIPFLLAPAPGWSAEINIGPQSRISRPVLSLKTLRDRNVVRQRFDYSCGAAALATILRYGYGDKVSEREILAQLFGLLSEDQKKISRQKGFSLLDLRRVAQARNYKAEGFRLEPHHIGKLARPVIVYIEPRGYKHFAVLRGIKGDRVFLADPSRGNIRMPMHTFLDHWVREDGKGIVLIVEPASGLPLEQTPLMLNVEGLPQPEIMTARQMLAVGNPYVQWPELSRW